MNNLKVSRWSALSAITLGALCSSLACSGAEGAETWETTGDEPATPPSGVEALSAVSEQDAEPFSLTPAGASTEEGFWVSSVGLDEAGAPVLLNARQISEAEMLEHADTIMKYRDASQDGASEQEGNSASVAVDGIGTTQQALGRQLSCDTGFAAPTYLGLYSSPNFQGNRMCVVGEGTPGWFRLYTWYWNRGQSNEMQVSGNIGSYVHFKRFAFDAWTEAGRSVQPVGWPTPFDWGETGRCFGGSAANCGNPNGCVSGSVSAGDVRGQCGQFVTWLRL